MKPQPRAGVGPISCQQAEGCEQITQGDEQPYRRGIQPQFVDHDAVPNTGDEDVSQRGTDLKRCQPQEARESIRRFCSCLCRRFGGCCVHGMFMRLAHVAFVTVYLVAWASHEKFRLAPIGHLPKNIALHEGTEGILR